MSSTLHISCSTDAIAIDLRLFALFTNLIIKIFRELHLIQFYILNVHLTWSMRAINRVRLATCMRRCQPQKKICRHFTSDVKVTSQPKLRNANNSTVKSSNKTTIRFTKAKPITVKNERNQPASNYFPTAQLNNKKLESLIRRDKLQDAETLYQVVFVVRSVNIYRRCSKTKTTTSKHLR